MKRYLLVVTIVFACAAPNQAQDQETDTSIGDRTPVENASPGRVKERAPGTWITAARERHQLINNARVNAARGGKQPGTLDGYEVEDGTTTTSTTDNTSGSGLSGLLDLVDQFGGISSLGNLGSLLGSLTSGDTTSTGDSSSATGSDGSGSMTIEDLLQLEEQLLGSSSGSAKESGRAQSIETRGGSGAIGRLPKIESRAQDTEAQSRKFVARWAESMAQTFFAGLALGFQSQDFIDFLKDQLRPIFFPSTLADDSDDTGSGDEDDSSGGGIEDLEPTDDSSDSDSII